MRAIGDGSRHFEPWSSDEDETRDDNPSPNFHHNTNKRALSVFEPPIRYSVPLRNGFALNRRRAASPLVKLKREGRSLNTPGVSLKIGVEKSKIVLVLKAKANDRRKNLVLSSDELHGP
ncbi:hypothetical protein TNCV_3660901 [Trichonephila clavipes]|nr:hypothetical protein TNCV_3660901 [Trichonephila clavipes]